MFFKKIILNLILIIIFTTSIYSIKIELNSTESINAIETSTNQIEITVTGNLKLTNPSLNDFIHQYEFKFRNDLVFSFNSINNEITFSNYNFKGENLYPNTTKIISYTLQSSIPTSYYNDFILSQKSFLEWSSQEILLKPLRNIKLNKLQRDNESQNFSSRKILITGKNPTAFDVSIKSIELFKTNPITNNDFLNNQHLLNSFTNINLNPQESFSITHNQINSTSEDIYWINSIVSANYTYNKNLTINFQGLSTTSKNSGSPSYISFSNKELLPLNIIKRSNKNKIGLNETINFLLEIQNPNSYSINNLKIEDSVPRFFKIDKKLDFQIPEIKPYETKQIKYSSKLTKNYVNEMIFIPPAKMTYNGILTYSNSLYLFSKDINLKEQLLLEKTIIHYNNKTSKIIIKIKNVGNQKVQNIKLIENTNSNNQTEIKSWIIPELNSKQEWKTEYTTKTQNTNYFIPNIFVEDGTEVYKTINTNNIVDSSIQTIESTTLTTVLIITTALLFFTDLIF